MSDDHKIKSLRASAVSTIALLQCEIEGSSENLADYREIVDEKLDDLLALLEPDPTSWAHFKGKLFYDIYLLQRQEEGTLSQADLTRRGVKSQEFSDPVEYHKHCIRVGETKELRDGPPKVCTSCGEEKPANKFKFRGGAKCNACRSREYRERKSAA
jgi:hypothetical protein